MESIGAALAGELVSFSVSPDRLTYSYTILETAYGLPVNTTRTGSLSKNPDGTFTPSADPSSRVAFLENGLVLGFARENFGSGVKSVPVISVRSPIQTVAESTGLYNFVQYTCDPQIPGACATYHGTFQLNSNGTFDACVSGNLASASPQCSSRSNGAFTVGTNGRFSAFQGGFNFGTALGFKNPSNEQKVLLIDLKDSRPAGFGRGVIVASQQVALTPEAAAGTYQTSGNLGAAKIVVNSQANGYTREEAGGRVVTGNVTLNNPWAGFARAEATAVNGVGLASRVNGYALMGGSGLFGYVDGQGPVPVAGGVEGTLGIRY